MGLSDADEVLFKADLAIAISRAIDSRGLSQAEAAQLAGLDQPKISALEAGDTRGFSVDRLFRILTRLGRDVRIQIQPSLGSKGRIRVASASARS
ncbi:MAG TPA: helix-turn-helix transcriptional regulator [Candidatus Baltobacteraceae bacterium]|nr:helix-turn-helix transcriptional regulator [Candidatus Baltobacteraceae bacterium]